LVIKRLGTYRPAKKTRHRQKTGFNLPEKDFYLRDAKFVGTLEPGKFTRLGELFIWTF